MNKTRLMIAASVCITGICIAYALKSDPSPSAAPYVTIPSATTSMLPPGKKPETPKPQSVPHKLSADKAQREDQKLELPGLRAFDWFGSIVAIDGNRILVGCGGDDSKGADLGSAHIFRRTRENHWEHEGTLRSHELRTHRRFGYTGAISGNTAAVGAQYDGSVTVFEADENEQWSESCTLRPDDVRPNQLFGGQLSLSHDLLLVGAAQDPEKGIDGGAAYVFRRQEGTWRQIAKLVSHDVEAHDQLGADVGLSGRTAIVGSRHNDGNTGSAYIFEENEGGIWKEVAKLKSVDPHPFDQFGISVAISDDTAVVGEWRDSEKGHLTGAAHLYQRTADGVWSHLQKLTAGDPAKNDGFGYAVAINEESVLIGTLRVHEGKRCGSSYLFRKDLQGQWRQIKKLLPSDSRPLDKFGSSVALSDKFAVVGAEGNSASVTSGGAAYVFTVENISKTIE